MGIYPSMPHFMSWPLRALSLVFMAPCTEATIAPMPMAISQCTADVAFEYAAGAVDATDAEEAAKLRTCDRAVRSTVEARSNVGSFAGSTCMSKRLPGFK